MLTTENNRKMTAGLCTEASWPAGLIAASSWCPPGSEGSWEGRPGRPGRDRGSLLLRHEDEVIERFGGDHLLHTSPCPAP